MDEYLKARRLTPFPPSSTNASIPSILKSMWLEDTFDDTGSFTHGPPIQARELLQHPSDPSFRAHHSLVCEQDSRPSRPYFFNTAPRFSSASQADFDMSCGYPYSSFPESNMHPASTYTSYPTQGGFPPTASAPEWGSSPPPVPTIGPAPQYATPPTFSPPRPSHPTVPEHHSFGFGYNMERRQQSGGPYTQPWLPAVGRVPLREDADPSVLNFVDPPVETNSAFILEHMVSVGRAAQHPLHTTSLPPQQPMPQPDAQPAFCLWTHQDGTLCWDVITKDTLSGHLSDKHGIKKKSRDYLLHCLWDNCKRKKPLNRESILRHIREVHLHLRRPTREGQELNV